MLKSPRRANDARRPPFAKGVIAPFKHLCNNAFAKGVVALLVYLSGGKAMSDFENNKVLDHLKELQEQLEAVNQKFHQIELELRTSGQSLEQVYVSHKNRLDLADQKQVNE